MKSLKQFVVCGWLCLLSGAAYAQMSVSKSSSVAGDVEPGDVIQYTITIDNNTGATRTGITVNDPMPAGLTYIPNSTVATGPVLTQVFEAEDQFSTAGSYAGNNGADNFIAAWTESDPEGASQSASAGDVYVTGGEGVFFNGRPLVSLTRSVNLSGSSAATATLSFDYRGIGDMETSDILTVAVSTNGTTYTTLEQINGATTGDFDCGVGSTTACSGSRSYDITAHISANTRIRFSVEDLNPSSEQMFIDNVRVVGFGASAPDTLDNQPGGTNGDLDDGDPADLVTINDGFTLDDGDSMTVTFYARVAAGASGTVTNTATVDSNEGGAIVAQASNTVDAGFSIGDYIWYDVDADGVQDGNEVGIPDAIVNLHAGSSCATPVIATTTTPVGGAYSFTGLSNGTYCVQVVESSMPTGYDPTTGTSNPQVVTISGSSLSNVDFGYRTTACLPLIDFETDAAGNALSAGETIDDEFLPWGLTFTGTGFGPMIFDSANPTGGDFDVGTPNEDFGGPGVGAEGGVGEPGENRISQNNVMIISEDGDSSDPDDNGGGGTVTITSSYQVQVGITTIVDMEENCGGALGDTPADMAAGEVRTYDAPTGGSLIDAQFIPGLGDNSQNSGPFLVGNNGRRIEIQLCGSGSIAVVSICENFPQEVFSEIGDRVWLDADGDGVQDIGEPGIQNVLVTLYNAGPDGLVGGGDDVAEGTLLTDNNGEYLFTDLEDGTYYTTPDTSTIPAGLILSPGSTANSTPTAVTNGDSNLTHDFGYTADPTQVIIGDLVWSDADNDGIRDPGEPGIGNVTIRLRTPGADGILGNGDDGTEATATTAADGTYRFAVDPGEYMVEVTDTNNALTGYALTSGPQSSTNPGVPLNMIGGDIELDQDFGYFQAGIPNVTDRAWLDVDQDGVQDLGEVGISGVTADLVNSSGVVIASTISDSNGDISFTSVVNGDYDIVITDTAGVLVGYSTTTTAAANGSQDVFVFGNDVSGVNFGYFGPGTIGDLVFSDNDGDGVRDPGELGIGGVTLTLWRDANGNGTLETGTDIQVDSTTTADNGSYLFEDVYVGVVAFTYFVSIDDTQAALSGYTHTTADEDAALGDQMEIVLQNIGDSDLTADFGYQNTALPDISGQVWHDLDADGFDDGAGEPGIPNVTLALINSAGNVVAATTALDGSYAFYDLPAGDYTVAVTDDNLVLTDYTITSGLDQIPITVVASDINNIDFGYVRDESIGQIGDLVWIDLNNDGDVDGNEPGIGGVDLELRNANTNALIATTTTDTSGNYLFTGLSAGNYYVDVVNATVPSGLSGTTGFADPSATINLSANEVYLDADFGYVSSTGSLAGDYVWADVDGDGIQDTGEIGISGVDITVDGPAGTFVVTTNSAGYWLVTGLTPGQYTVNYDASDLPAGFGTTPTNTTPQYTFDVSAGGNYLYLDYGFQPGGSAVGSIGDTVFLDVDGDGTQDAGEPGLQNVTLNLLDNGGNVIASTITDGNGNYDFLGVLPANDYEVEVTDVNGVVTGLRLSTPAVGMIDIVGGQDYNDAVFGYQPTGLTIGTLVWRDLNGDGDRDAGEPGVSGVTVEIWLDNGSDSTINPGTDNLLETLSTNSQGTYLFTGLVAGDYVVRVTDDLNVLSGFSLTSGTANTDNNSQANPFPVTLSTLNILYADFGYYVAPPNDYELSGRVFEDVDDDGMYDASDPDVQGATLSLYRDQNGNMMLDSGEPLLDTTTSASDGTYLFMNLPAGDYIVVSDTSGTFVDGYTQTTQQSTGGVQPATIVNADSTDNDFGYNGGAVTVPVTLGWVQAVRSGDQILIDWETTTETANAGFEFRAVVDGKPGPLLTNIVPSRVVDSVHPQQYQTAVTSNVDAFFIVDRDTRGGERVHGPFDVNKSHGLRTESHPVNWADIRLEHAALATGRGGQGEPDWIDVRVTSTGLQRIPFSALVDAGIDWFGTPAASLRLRSGSQEIGMWIDGGESLSTASAIYFFGEAKDTLYTETNVYRLYRTGGAHANQTSPLAAGGEELTRLNDLAVRSANLRYGFSAPVADPWYMDMVAAFGGPDERTYSFDLSDATLEGVAAVVVDAWGITNWATDPDHHLEVYLNDVLVHDGYFDGQDAVQVRALINARQLVQGVNEIRVVVPGDTGVDYDLVAIERAGIEYQRTAGTAEDHIVIPRGDLAGLDPDQLFAGGFEAESSRQLIVGGFAGTEVRAFAVNGDALIELPTAVSAGGVGFDVAAPELPGATHYVLTRDAAAYVPELTKRWSLSTAIDADVEYLMITHENFADALEVLADFHRARGLNVAVVTTQAIYDEYSAGVFDAEAIRSHLADALAEAQLEWVLLVGSDSYDYRDYTGNASLSLVPTLYRATGDLVRYAPVDPAFVDADGNGVPDVAIGRIPARTVAELEAVIDKTISFANTAGRQRALFASDRNDGAMSFQAISAQMTTHLPAGWLIQETSLQDRSLDQARFELLGALESGMDLVSYIGHSSYGVWSFDSLLTRSDVLGLGNSRYPMITQWGCWNTYFIHPDQNTMAQLFLMTPDAGAVSVLGATTLTQVSHERELAERVLLRATQGMTIGEAVTQAKQDLALTHPTLRDVLLGWTLLGDPAITLD